MDLPDPNKTEPITEQKVPSQSSSSAMTDEEKKRAARLKIKNALLGAAASAGNDNLKTLMQAHLASPGIPIQQSSSTSNIVKSEIRTGSLISESNVNPGRVRRSSECGNPADDVLDIINQVANPVKIIIQHQDPELIYSPLTSLSNLSHGE